MASHPNTDFSPGQKAAIAALLDRLSSDNRGLLEELRDTGIVDPVTGDTLWDLTPQTITLWTEHFCRLEREVTNFRQAQQVQSDLEDKITEFRNELEKHSELSARKLKSLHEDISNDTYVEERELQALEKVKTWIRSHPRYLAELSDVGLAATAPVSDTVQQAIQEFEALSLKNQNLGEALPKLETEAETARTRISALETELAAGNQKLNEECARLLAEAEANRHLEKELASLKQTHDECPDQMQELQQSSNRWKNDFQKIRDERDDVVEANKTLRKQAEELATAKSAAESRANASDRKLAAANQLVKDQQADLGREQEAVKQKQSQITNLRNERLALESGLAEKTGELVRVSEDKKNLAAKLGQEVVSREAAEKALSESRAEVKTLITASEAQKAEISNLNKRLEEQSRELSEQMSLASNRKARMEALKNETSGLRQDLLQAREDSDNKAAQIESLGTQKDEAVEQVQGLNLEKATLNQRLAEAQKALKEREESYKAALEQVSELQAAKVAVESDLEKSRVASEGRSNHIKKLTATVTDTEATVSQLGHIISLIAGPATTDMQAICNGWSVVRSMADALGETPLNKPCLTFMDGLTKLKVSELPAQQQAVNLFLQAHSDVRTMSVSAVAALAVSFDHADQWTQRECLPMLYAIVVKMSSRPKLSFAGSMIFLQCLELLVSAFSGEATILSAVADLLRQAESRLNSDRLLVRAMLQVVSSRIDGREPNIGVSIASLAEDRGSLAQLTGSLPDDDTVDDSAAFQVSMDEDDLLVVNAAGEVVFLRPPYFRLDDEQFFRSIHITFLVFEDAPLVGSRSLRLVLDAADPYNTLNLFRPLLDAQRFSQRFPPESRVQVELIDE